MRRKSRLARRLSLIQESICFAIAIVLVVTVLVSNTGGIFGVTVMIAVLLFLAHAKLVHIERTIQSLRTRRTKRGR